MLTALEPVLEQFEQLTRHILPAAGVAVPMDAIRRPDEILLRFDVPGIDPESIEVSVDRGVLTVQATREHYKPAEDERLFVNERPAGTFTRQIYLSEHLDADGIQAAYADGVLAVRVPVLETAKPRKIQVTASKSAALTG